MQENLPLIGRSPAMQEIYRVLARLMSTDLTVLISGESGTGKELVARALHEYGKRRNGPFIAINMAAIPRELIESELFGHEKGAFTGADTRYAGRFEQADGGTLFLDEIGDMPLDAQTRLLRVLQEGEFTTVGGRDADPRRRAHRRGDPPRPAASWSRQGLFREDLYYRLNVVPLRLPPLRERADDIPDLVRHFLTAAAAEGLPSKALDNAAMERLKRHRWPGNVRELENVVRRFAALYSQETITADVVEAELADVGPANAANSADEEESLDRSGRTASQDLFRRPRGRAAGVRALRPGAARGRAAADPAQPHGDARQPGPRGAASGARTATPCARKSGTLTLP